MWFKKNEIYLFFVNNSPNRGYFHLVEHSQKLYNFISCKEQQRAKGERARNNERESVREREREANGKRENSKIRKKSFKQRGRILNLLHT